MWPKKLKKMPKVKMVMTPFPYSIDEGESLEKAREMMTEHRIHHLPVMTRGAPIGVVSHRNLSLALEGDGKKKGAKVRTVADLPLEGAYVVDLSEPLDRVLQQMAENHLGAALVVKKGRLAGIFTLTDACQCFAEHLRREFPPKGGDEAA